MAIQDSGKSPSPGIRGVAKEEGSWSEKSDRLSSDDFLELCALNKSEAALDFLDNICDLEEDVSTILSYRNKHGENCMSLCAAHGCLNLLRLLYEYGGSLDGVDGRGRTPLMHAALWGQIEVVKFLLTENVDALRVDKKGKTAEFYAQSSEDTKRLRRIILFIRKSKEKEQIGAEKHREVIASILRDHEPRTASRGHRVSIRMRPKKFTQEYIDERFFITYSFGKEIVQYRVRDHYQTVARLYRGSLFEVQSALSGWEETSTMKTSSNTGHGRIESGSCVTLSIILFPKTGTTVETIQDHTMLHMPRRSWQLTIFIIMWFFQASLLTT